MPRDSLSGTQPLIEAHCNRAHIHFLRVLAQVELDFNSVERIIEYLEVPQEAPAVVQEKRPPAAWPSSNGELVVQDLVVRYAPHLPAVLKNLSFSVRPAEKIGIVSWRSFKMHNGPD